jgi:hypothetical protein
MLVFVPLSLMGPLRTHRLIKSSRVNFQRGYVPNIPKQLCKW